VLQSAAAVATGPPSGPVFLSVPQDVLEAPLIASTLRPPGVRAACGPEDVGPLLDALTTAECPVIVVGGQIRRDGGTPALEQLASDLGLAVFYEPSWNDRLSIAPGHPCTLGPFGNPVARRFEHQADAVLLVGAKFFREAHPITAQRFPNASFVAHVNATPERVAEVWTADWSAVCSPRLLLQQLLEGAARRPIDSDLLARRRQRVADARSARVAVTGPFAPAALALHDSLDHGWVVDESVSASHVLLNAMTSMDGRRFVTTGGASLGWATGAACGVALGSGEAVTCVLGDGALRFGLQGLWTAKCMNLPITYVVLDNGGFGSTRYFEREYVARSGAPEPAAYLGSDLRDGPQCESLLSGFEIQCKVVHDPAAIREAIEASWKLEGPSAVVVRVPFDS